MNFQTPSRQGEVPIHELVHPCTAALEVKTGALDDNALGILLGQKSIRRWVFGIIARHESHIHSIPR